TPPGAAALNVIFGRFDAPLGFERDDEPLNLIPTNSFNFGLARPAKLTGLVARYTLSTRLAAALIAANGWDAAIDNNSGKTGDLLDDPDVFTTGTPQTLRSLTVSPWYFYREAQEGIFSAIEHTSFRLPAFALRPALRFDHSTAAFFAEHTGGFTRTHVSAVVELVYLF